MSDDARPAPDDAGAAPELAGGVHVLACQQCSAPLAFTDAALARCPFCAAETPVPDDYRTMLRNRRSDRALRALADRTLGRLDRPPNLVVKVLARMFDLNMFVFMILYGIPYGLGAIFGSMAFVTWLAPHIGAKDADAVPFWIDGVAAFVIMFLLAFLPRALGVFANRRATDRSKLLNALAARPPTRAGGPATCRACGAPLTVLADELAVPCTYCGAENGVAIVHADVATGSRIISSIGRSIQEVIAHERDERRRTRRMLGRELWRYTWRTAVLGGLWVLSSQTTADNKPTTLGLVAMITMVLLFIAFVMMSMMGSGDDDAEDRKRGNDVPGWIVVFGPILAWWGMSALTRWYFHRS